MSPKRVLIIDDSTSFRELVRNHFHDSGVEVIEAENGLTGLDLFSRKAPDAVFVDLRMPEMDGFEVLEELSRRSMEVPYIVITDAAELQDAIRSIRIGAWDFVIKDDHVVEEMERALSKGFERASYLRSQRESLEVESKERQWAESALKNQLAFVQTVIDAVPNQIFFKDINGVYLGCNKAFEEFTGISRVELMGMRVEDFALREKVRFIRTRIASCWKGRGVRNMR